MRIRSALPLLPAIVLMASGCSSDSGNAAVIAAQADRVADLLEEQQPCQATEALRALENLIDADTRPVVRQAVADFVGSARTEVTCPSETASPSPTPTTQAPADPVPDAPVEPDPDPVPEEPADPGPPEDEQPPGREEPPGQDRGGGNQGNGGGPGRGRGGP